MKNNFNRQLWTAAAIAAATMFAGCFGAGVQSGVEVGTTNNYFGSGPTASEVADQPVQPLPKTEKVILLQDQRDLLRLSIKSEGNSADEKELAAGIAQRTKGALSADDAKIVTDDKFDVRTVIRPKLTIVDQDGDYYRMNSTVEIEIKSFDGRRVFGTNKIDVVSQRRVLGKNAAISRIEEAAADKVAEWCRQQLKQITNSEVGATVLSIQLPTVPEGEARNSQEDAANIKAVGNSLAKLPNLISYELIGQDLQAGTCQYRVVYFISAYPNGISNEVGALIGTVKQ